VNRFNAKALMNKPPVAYGSLQLAHQRFKQKRTIEVLPKPDNSNSY
jgi:hypothetical protein